MNNIENFEYFFDDVESCECIGMFEDEYVYDIEIDDNTHTFIGNDILIHNSLYITFAPFMISANYDYTKIDDALKFIHHINSVFVKFLFNDLLEIYAKKYNVKNLHDFELETINASGLYVQKKQYINNCVYEDGAYYENLTHFNTKGVEIVKSSSPPFVRERIWDFLNYIFKNPKDTNMKDIIKIVRNIKKEFVMANMDTIALQTSLSNYEQKVIDDQTGVQCVKGAHFSVKAAALHNYLLNKNSHFKTQFDLLRGGKIKFYHCKHPLGDRFAYMRNFHPTDLTIQENVIPNYDLHFSKAFLSICNRFLDPMGLPSINRRLTILNSLFDIKKHETTDNDVDYDDGVEEEEIYVRQLDDVVLVEDDNDELIEMPTIQVNKSDFWDDDENTPINTDVFNEFNSIDFSTYDAFLENEKKSDNFWE